MQKRIVILSIIALLCAGSGTAAWSQGAAATQATTSTLAAPTAPPVQAPEERLTVAVFDFASREAALAETCALLAELLRVQMGKGTPGQVEALAQELGQKVCGLIEKGSGELLAKVRLSGTQLAELRNKLAGKPLPRVFVYVREQVVNVPVPDPAAQTEIGYILRKVGCELVKDRDGRLARWADEYLDSGNKTAPPVAGEIDLVLVGEGISQFASRTGDLVSSRARVELEALDVKTGKALAVDRETFVGVDLAEQIAAKTALQEAAAIRLRFNLLMVVNEPPMNQPPTSARARTAPSAPWI